MTLLVASERSSWIFSNPHNSHSRVSCLSASPLLVSLSVLSPLKCLNRRQLDFSRFVKSFCLSSKRLIQFNCQLWGTYNAASRSSLNPTLTPGLSWPRQLTWGWKWGDVFTLWPQWCSPSITPWLMCILLTVGVRTSGPRTRGQPHQGIYTCGLVTVLELQKPLGWEAYPRT